MICNMNIGKYQKWRMFVTIQEAPEISVRVEKEIVKSARRDP